MERTYRKKVKAAGLVSFQVTVKESDLWVSADKMLEKETRDLVLMVRQRIEHYISRNPGFATTLQPFPKDPYAPDTIKEMIEATMDIGVGPMASVAGAVAQFVACGLMKLTGQVIVENGGDIYLKANRPVTVSVFAGDSPLSGKIGLKIPAARMPLGVCSSSGRVGHSLSRGTADVICLVSPSAIRADGAATALGNRLKSKKDLDRIAEWAGRIDGIQGGLAIMGDAMAAWGDVTLIAL